MRSSNHSHLPNPDSVAILGVRVLSPWAQKSAWIESMLQCPEAHLLVTANPEILVRTTRDDRYRSIVQNAHAVIADGFGIVLAGLLKGKRLQRLTGVELTKDLLRIAQEKDLPVHFALFGSGLTTLDDIRALFPDLRLSSQFEAAIVIANFGAPKQEYWLDEHKHEFPNARVLVGVGGALDYLCGKVRRAPALLRAIGLEWVWRLMRQPKRWKRIWNAVIVFPIKIILE